MLAGIDVGSTGLKLALFNEQGKRLGYAYREYMIEYGKNGQAVLDPEIWWNSLQSCVEELSHFLDLHYVEAIGISSANAMVLTDENLKPLFPAIMQLDKRGAEMVGMIREELGDVYIFEKTGNRNAPGYQWGPALKWLQVHEPQPFSLVRKIFNPTSYLVARLTGVYSMDCTRAATTLLYNTEKGCWDKELWDYFGLSKVDQPVVFTCDQVVGKTIEEAGFPAEIPVVAGGIDTICAMLGLCSGADGDVLIMGSVGRFAASVNEWNQQFLNTVSWDGRQKISMTPVNNAGTALKWIRKILFSSGDGQTEGYELLNQMAEQVPPGSDGLLFFPYLNGASCPRWEETVRGTFLGLESYHTAGHLIRSVMEGVAFSLGENQQLLKQCGSNDGRPLYLGGGGAKSLVWSQILSDVLGRELLIPEQSETETMGAAMLGGFATDRVALEQIENWNCVKKKVFPVAEHQELYLERQILFSKIHAPLKQVYLA